MNLREEILKARTRRQLFKDSVTGLGTIALASLLNEDLPAAAPTPDSADPLRPKPPHFPARAKNIIYLHMAGAPSTLDMFDYKPKLNELNGQYCPDSYIRGQQFAFIKGKPKLLGSPHRFAPRGKSGQVMSDILPHLATVADDIAIIRSMYTDQFNHAPAQLFLHTGSARLGRPSMGSLAVLWARNREPRPAELRRACLGHRRARWRHVALGKRLPADHPPRSPIAIVGRSRALPLKPRRHEPRAAPAVDRQDPGTQSTPSRRRGRPRDPHADLAVRDGLQDAVQRAGADGHRRTSHARSTKCTAPGPARKRSPTTACWRGGWSRAASDSSSSTTGAGTSTAIDKSNDIRFGLVDRCQETDQPIAALIKDLKQRGLLDETLIVWGGEFGRTPMNEERDGSKWLGRDHNQHAFTIWMAGGGVKRGITLRRNRRPGIPRRRRPDARPRSPGHDPAPHGP